MENNNGLPQPMTQEEFDKVKLMVCTPMFGGQAYSSYISSALDIKHHCLVKYKIPVEFVFVCNQSLISEARNDLVSIFMESSCTHMLFQDADVGFPGDQLGNMIAQNMDIAVGSYPKKSINWDRVAEVARSRPDMDPIDLESVASDHAINTVDGPFRFDRPAEVQFAGTGLMLIKREVFERFRKHYGDEGRVYSSQGREHYDYFRIGIREGKYTSEDVSFCQEWRAMGGKIWMLPWIRTVHEGTTRFQGNVPMMSVLLDPDYQVKDGMWAPSSVRNSQEIPAPNPME